MPDYGIDVSGFNTVTSWPAVRGAGNTWAWSKATQGGGYTNPQFASQFTGSRMAGLITGAYHFPDPNVSVAANVAHFVAAARPLGAFAAGAFLPMLDVENDSVDGIVWTAASANAFIPAFRDQLRAATGQRKLCVYAPQSWWATGMLRPNDWADSDIFLCAARYGVAPGDVGWSHPRLAVHQYTDAAATPGVTKPTDRSVTVNGFTAAAMTVGGSSQKESEMFEYIVDLGSDDGHGNYARCALLSGGVACGADWSDAAAMEAKGKAVTNGLPTDQYNDWLHKSDQVTGLLGAIQGLPAALAAAIPVSASGLTADALSAAVAAGVRAGLDGVTETTTLHKPA